MSLRLLTLRCRRALLAALSVGLLAGCASTPDVTLKRPETVQRFSLDGRFSLRQGNDNNSGNVTWDHGPDGDDIFLSTPLGQGVARLTGNAQRASLSLADKRRFDAPDMEQLSEQTFGTRLPLRQMPAWVAARPVGDMAVRRDERGRPQHFQADGWGVDYLDYEGPDALALPRLIRLERGDIELRLRILSWDEVE